MLHLHQRKVRKELSLQGQTEEKTIDRRSYKEASRSIYALIDARDNTIRYIGCAIDIDERLSGHMHDRSNTPKCQWLAELKQQGLLPRVEVLETGCSFSGAFNSDERHRPSFPLTSQVIADYLTMIVNEPSMPSLWKAGRLAGWIEALMENDPHTFRSFSLEERMTVLQGA